MVEARRRFEACVVVVMLAGCGAKGSDASGGAGAGGGQGGTGAQGGGGGGDLGDAAAAGDAPIGPRPDPAVPVFDESLVHQVDLTMAPEDWQSLLDDSRGDDWRHARVVYDGAVIEDVGVRPSGESSRFAGNPKMSLRVKFDAFADRGHFGGLKEVKLKGGFGDQSMMRDRLAYFLFRAGGVPAPSATHARVTVNGDRRGLFMVVEVWDSQSIQQRFTAPFGPLYRLRGGDMADMNDPYLYVGDGLGPYVPLPWEQHMSNPARGDDVIPSFLKVLAQAPGKLDDVADTDELLAFLACNAVVMNTDGLTGDSGVEDHFQYFDPAQGKFVALPWDPDNTFGSSGEMPTRTIYAHFSKSTLTRIVRDTGNFRQRYRDKIKAVMAAVPLDTLVGKVETVHQQIADAAHEDPVKPFSNDSFDWNLLYIKTFASARYAELAGQVGP